MHGSYNGAGALEPMRNLSHAEAVRYCETAGKNLGGVLPTQEQWEMAARAGSDGNVYPWDHYAGPKKAWYDKKSSPCPVGYSGKNAAGVEDIAGNVWEWCADEAEFVRGGAYDSPTADLRISARKKKNPEIGYADVGFRCVLATEPTPS
jgi:formylglycine-generating enzyme